MKKTDQNPEKSEKELEDLKLQLTEATDRWKRALADYQNLEKRASEEKREFARFAAKQFIEKLLIIVDDLEKAEAHLKDQGLSLTVKKMIDLLKQEGVEKLTTVGREYDIESMEAIQLVPGKEDNKVVEELRPGYTMHGSILRAAQVKVSKKS